MYILVYLGVDGSLEDWQTSTQSHDVTDVVINRLNSSDNDGTSLYKQLYAIYCKSDFDMRAGPYIYYEGKLPGPIFIMRVSCRPVYLLWG